MEQFITSIFGLSEDVRYVAVYDGEHLASRSRPGRTASSDGESDRYEELLVNPTLLFLARQRGRIDCGGLRHILVGYGNFDQFVLPLGPGHVSICLEHGVDLNKFGAALEPLLRAFLENDSEAGHPPSVPA